MRYQNRGDVWLVSTSCLIYIGFPCHFGWGKERKDGPETFKLGFADDELFGSENLWDRCPKIQIFVGLESDMSCCKDFRRCFAFIYCICVHCTLVIWPVGRHSQLKSHFGCAKYGKIISTCEGIRRRSRGSDGHYKAVSKSIYIYIYIHPDASSYFATYKPGWWFGTWILFSIYWE